jgi:hypothetical protein
MKAFPTEPTVTQIIHFSTKQKPQHNHQLTKQNESIFYRTYSNKNNKNLTIIKKTVWKRNNMKTLSTLSKIK